MVSKSPKHYARMIRDHVKSLPDHYADDPTSVQEALGLNDEEFDLGLTFCIAKKIIVLEKPQTAKAAASEVVMKKTMSFDDNPVPDKKPSPFADDDMRQQKISTNELTAVFSA